MAEIKEYIRTVKNNGDVILSNIIDSKTGEAIEFIKVQNPTGTEPLGTLFKRLNTAVNGIEIFKRIYLGNIDIKWFGAKGDGITDDTSTVQLAVDTLQILGGGILFFPPGRYNISNILIKGRGIHFLGDSTRTSFLIGSSGNMFQMGDSTSGASAAEGSFQKLQIRNIAANNGDIFNVFALNKCKFYDCIIVQENPTKRILTYNNTLTVANKGGLYFNEFEKIDFYHVASGTVNPFYVWTQTPHEPFNSNRFKDCTATFCGRKFFSLGIGPGGGTYNISNNQFNGFAFEVCNGGGLEIYSGEGNIITGAGFHDTGTFTDHLIFWGRSSSANAPSKYNSLISYYRTGGAPANSGIFDICQGTATGDSKFNIIESPGLATYAVKLNIGTVGSSGTTYINLDKQKVVLQQINRANDNEIGNDGNRLKDLIVQNGAITFNTNTINYVTSKPDDSVGSEGDISFLGAIGGTSFVGYRKNSQGIWKRFGYISQDLNLIVAGTTAQRPIPEEIGFKYFDTTQNQLIIWNGSAWVGQKIRTANTTDVVTKAFLNITYPIATYPIDTVVTYYSQGKEYTRQTATIWTETLIPQTL